MIRFFRLVQNEHIKLYKRVSTYIMAGILLLIVIASGILLKVSGLYENSYAYDWKQYINEVNQSLEEQINNPAISDEEKIHLRSQLELNKNRLKYDVADNSWKMRVLYDVQSIEAQKSVTSDELQIKELDEKLKALENYLENNDWEAFYKSSKASLQEQISSSDQDELIKKSSEIQMEIIDLRLKYNISPDDMSNWKNGALSSLENNKTQLLYLTTSTDTNDERKGMNPNLTEEQKREQIKNYNEKISIDTYRLENDIAPLSSFNTQWGYTHNIIPGIIGVILVFLVIAAGSSISNEFSEGTIKLLMIRPFRRWEILLSKYLTIFIYAAELMLILFASTYLTGGILFGFDTPNIFLYYDGATVHEQSIVIRILFEMLLNSVPVIMIFTLAFMLSTVIKNSALAIGLSLILYFLSDLVILVFTELLKFEWIKYFFFANWNLAAYYFTEGASPPVEGMTLVFSCVILIITFLIINFISFLTFEKRDIAT